MKPDQITATAAKGGALCLKLSLSISLARHLGLGELGVFYLYTAGLLLAAGIMGADGYIHTIRLILKEKIASVSHIERYAGLLLICLMFGCPLAVILMGMNESFLFDFLLVCFAVHLCLETVNINVARFLIPLGRPLASNLLLFLSNLWIAPVILILELGEIELILSQVIVFWLVGSAVSTVFGYVLLNKATKKWIFPFVDIGWISSILMKSVMFFLATLLFRTILGLDKFLIESVLDLKVVGIYATFLSIGTGVISLLEAGVSAWRYPELVSLLQQKDFLAAKGLYKNYLWENALFCAFLVTVLVVLFPIVVQYFMAAEFNNNISIFYWIMGGVFMFGCSLPSQYLLYGLEKDHVFIFIYLSSLVVMLVVGYFLVPILGYIGSGVMMGLTLSSVAILRFTLASKLLNKVV